MQKRQPSTQTQTLQDTKYSKTRKLHRISQLHPPFGTFCSGSLILLMSLIFSSTIPICNDTDTSPIPYRRGPTNTTTSRSMPGSFLPCGGDPQFLIRPIDILLGVKHQLYRTLKFLHLLTDLSGRHSEFLRQTHFLKNIRYFCSNCRFRNDKFSRSQQCALSRLFRIRNSKHKFCSSTTIIH
jgi:hypothetical protein